MASILFFCVSFNSVSALWQTDQICKILPVKIFYRKFGKFCSFDFNVDVARAHAPLVVFLRKQGIFLQSVPVLDFELRALIFW